MRISDWSSDVCSSDLDLPRSHPRTILSSGRSGPPPAAEPCAGETASRRQDIPLFPLSARAHQLIFLAAQTHTARNTKNMMSARKNRNWANPAAAAAMQLHTKIEQECGRARVGTDV